MEDSTLPKDPNPKFQPADDGIPENKPHFSTLAYVATALLVCIIVFVAVIGIWLYRRRRAARRLDHLSKHPPPPLLQHHVPIGHPLYTPMRSGLMTPLNEENSEDTSGPVGDEPAGAPVGRAAVAHQGRSTNYGLVPSTSTGSFSGSMEPPSPSMNSVSHNSVSTPASAFAMSMSGRGGGVEMSAIPEDAPLNRHGPSSASHSISINEDSVHMPPRQSLVMGR